MNASENIRATYIAWLEDHAFAGVGLELYLRVYDDLSKFLGIPSEYWCRQDLERFLMQRTLSLSAQERGAYGHALGAMAEVLDEVANGRTWGFESGGKFQHGDTSAGILRRNTEVQEAPPGPEGSPQPQRTDRTDFLPETMARIDVREERGSRPKSSPSNRPLSSPGQARVDTPSPGSSSHLGVTLRHCENERCVEVAWEGFVQGAPLRRGLSKALMIAERHAASGLLLDLREASVLSQDDTNWFEEWLSSLGESAVNRVALIGPERTIARLQLHRIYERTGLRHLESRRVDVAIFDTMIEAFGWLQVGTRISG